jgi:hypothetical protein
VNELRCTSVRIGSRLVLVPDGQPIVADVVYGPAPAELVYRTFYEATHCPNGHLRALYARERPDRGRIVHHVEFGQYGIWGGTSENERRRIRRRRNRRTA